MKILLEYFGALVFAFVLMVGAIILIPRAMDMPDTSPGELVGLGLALFVIGGGFTWYYLAATHQGRSSGPAPV